MKKIFFYLFLIIFVTLLGISTYYFFQYKKFANPYPQASKGYILKLIFLEGYRYSTLKSFLETKNSEQKESKIVTIPKKPVHQISALLEKEGLIKSSKQFLTLIRLKNIDRMIKTGEFEFFTDMKPEEVLDVLLSGKEAQFKVTFPENITYIEMGDILEKVGITKASDFVKLCESEDILKKYDIKYEAKENYKPTLEGYLYPETYYFKRNTPASEVIDRLISNTREKLEVYKDKIKEYGWSEHDLLTFASLIGKETGTEEELSKVSSVFHNRLKKGMLLQTDPTVIYMVTDRKSTKYHAGITKKHLLDKTNPYNTYIYKGLPPGPIGNPNIRAIQAVLYPASTSYIFFVSNNDGTHTFTTNLEAHEKAVKEYWSKVRKSQKAGN
ncbi:endolytic transglycosylase MltG [bacterium]|nr:endolytic transglycosylase MltG [bacterium]